MGSHRPSHRRGEFAGVDRSGHPGKKIRAASRFRRSLTCHKYRHRSRKCSQHAQWTTSLKSKIWSSAGLPFLRHPCALVQPRQNRAICVANPQEPPHPIGELHHVLVRRLCGDRIAGALRLKGQTVRTRGVRPTWRLTTRESPVHGALYFPWTHGVFTGGGHSRLTIDGGHFPHHLKSTFHQPANTCRANRVRLDTIEERANAFGIPMWWELEFRCQTIRHASFRSRAHSRRSTGMSA